MIPKSVHIHAFIMIFLIYCSILQFGSAADNNGHHASSSNPSNNERGESPELHSELTRIPAPIGHFSMRDIVISYIPREFREYYKVSNPGPRNRYLVIRAPYTFPRSDSENWGRPLPSIDSKMPDFYRPFFRSEAYVSGRPNITRIDLHGIRNRLLDEPHFLFRDLIASTLKEVDRNLYPDNLEAERLDNRGNFKFTITRPPARRNSIFRRSPNEFFSHLPPSLVERIEEFGLNEERKPYFVVHML